MECAEIHVLAAGSLHLHAGPWWALNPPHNCYILLWCVPAPKAQPVPEALSFPRPVIYIQDLSWWMRPRLSLLTRDSSQGSSSSELPAEALWQLCDKSCVLGPAVLTTPPQVL